MKFFHFIKRAILACILCSLAGQAKATGRYAASLRPLCEGGHPTGEWDNHKATDASNA